VTRLRIVALVIVVVACARDRGATELRFSGGQVERIETYDSEVTVYLRESVGFLDFLDLRGFGEFVSEEPLWELVRAMPPDRVLKVRGGERFEYSRPQGEIAVLRREISSEGVEHEKWELYFRMRAPMRAVEYQPVFGDYAEHVPEEGEVVVLSEGGEGQFRMKLRDGFVEDSYLAWPQRNHIRQRS
jgi:hypothetical protein